MATSTQSLVPLSELPPSRRCAVLLSVSGRALAALLVFAALGLLPLTMAGLLDAGLAPEIERRAGPNGVVVLAILSIPVWLLVLHTASVLSLRLFLGWALRARHSGYALVLLEVTRFTPDGAAEEVRALRAGALPREIRRHLYWRFVARVLAGFVLGLGLSPLLLAPVVLVGLPVFLAHWLLEASPPDAEFLLVQRGVS